MIVGTEFGGSALNWGTQAENLRRELQMNPDGGPQ